VYQSRSNSAVTERFPFITTTQVPSPLHPLPRQSSNSEPLSAVAVKVTVVPLGKVAIQVVPQSMPLGTLVTVPDPDPVLLTVKLTRSGVASNCATTVWLLLITVTQVPVPLQPPPLHPTNVDPLAATAVKVTDVPLAKLALQVPPQLIPAGVLVTVPLPGPVLLTVKMAAPADGLNVAVTA
jgi:hypothetical protein